MKVRWLRAAVRNLDQAADFIAEDDPQAATRIVRRLKDAVDHLADHPAIGRVGRVPETRELIVPGTPFIIPYRVKNQTIEILRVLHSSQRWPKDES